MIKPKPQVGETVWAFDPGETTGYCALKCVSLAPTVLKAISIGQMAYWHELDDLPVESRHHIMYESAFAGSLAFNPAPFEVIGALKHYCSTRNLRLDVQVPSRPAFIQRRFPEICLPGQPHALDALRHAVFYFYTRYALTRFTLRVSGKDIAVGLDTARNSTSE
jgi:hypothetical protein